MNNGLKLKLFIGLAGLAMIVSVRAAGPTSTLYLTAGDQGTNATIAGGTTTAVTSPQQFPANGGEYGIAISGNSIRTMHNGSSGGGGGTYDLSFAYTGPALANPAHTFYDGTSDGTYNYAVDIAGSVYRYNLDWSSPTLLFTPSGVSDAIGISFDAYNNSLWISGISSGTVQDYSLTGTLLSSFNNGQVRGFALAYDPADDTLWMMSVQNSGIIRQYNTSGELLQTMDFGSTLNYLGAEFAVPEPSSGVLMGGMLAVLAGVKMRRRRKQG
ncbi:MAG: PEP-CTERM sorting domain-containing protein [Verrucomicrobiota bacterium]|jgi:hypothetical protein